MILPRDLIARGTLCDQLVRQCDASRIDRFNFYQVARNYFLFGSSDQQGCPYNKIRSTVETLLSFIYSPDTIRFSLQLGIEAPHEDYAKAVPLALALSERWRISRTHIAFSQAVLWSLVYGVMLVKSMWTGPAGVRSFLVEPHQFGVLREDNTNLDDQEAFTHHYTITRTELESMLEGEPRQKVIMARAGRAMSDQLPPLSNGLSRLIIGSPVGGVPGSQAIPGSGNMVGPGGLGGRSGPVYDYMPKMEAELIDMCDLYVWDDEIHDYRVITRAAPDVVVYDRPSSWLGHAKGSPPFSVVRPDFNLHDYFWGDSFVANLTWLQDWRTERTMDVRSLLRRQFKPPMSITGGVGIQEEKMQALYAVGGQLSLPNPTAKINTHMPQMPDNVFQEIAQIDAMFDDQAGLGHVLQGKGEAGVRSKGQADLMARLASSRPKQRAVAVEESAEALARQMLRLEQDHSPQRYVARLTTGQDLVFTAEQFTKDYEVKVDGHSSSPVFVEDRKHDALTLHERGVIDGETLLDMFDPPNLQDLKERLKKIEAAREKQRQEELKAEAAGHKTPHVKRVA